MAEVMTVSVYRPGPVERFGRSIKLEYVGMTSVYVLIAYLVFGGLPTWYLPVVGGIGGFFLFLGLKKKTRDHLSGSLILLAACWMARPAVVDLDWAVSFMLFAACVCAMEGYVERRQEQVFVLPFVFLGWGWRDVTWVPALAFVALYLTHPWSERPGLRRRLGWIFALSAVAPWVGQWLRSDSATTPFAAQLMTRHPLSSSEWIALACVALATLICLAFYWRRLLLAHRLNAVFFALLAPWDERWMAMFAMVAAVLLTATVFRHSIDSDALRPYFKHAEWHYFWYVFALALWVVVA